MHKEYYEVSRVKNFCDAVFSIALTLLIFEISLPIFKNPVSISVIDILNAKAVEFLGFIVSFFVIVLYWVSHMNNMVYPKRMDKRLRVNLLKIPLINPRATGLK